MTKLALAFLAIAAFQPIAYTQDMSDGARSDPAPQRGKLEASRAIDQLHSSNGAWQKSKFLRARSGGAGVGRKRRSAWIFLPSAERKRRVMGEAPIYQLRRSDRLYAHAVASDPHRGRPARDTSLSAMGRPRCAVRPIVVATLSDPLPAPCSALALKWIGGARSSSTSA